MKARLLALYLPQFHPIPENDLWWGKGFTEWTNVGKAQRYFRNHYQPRVPADLGYYDLRVAETRQAQADMAREYGVEGFVYWHYWFGNGKRLLERPFNEVLACGEPDFPFALAWANESWRGFAHGITNRNMLIEQLYGGVEDYTAHFRAVLPAFRDHRYITVDGKPLFMIYKPLADPEVKVFIATWRELAERNGLPGIYFVGHDNAPVPNIEAVFSTGVDAVNPLRLVGYFNVKHSFFERQRIKFDRWRKIPLNYPYERMAACFLDRDEDTRENVFPSVIPNWDHTPRSGREGWIVTDSTPELFGKHLRKAVEMVRGEGSRTPGHSAEILERMGRGKLCRAGPEMGTRVSRSHPAGDRGRMIVRDEFSPFPCLLCGCPLNGLASLRDFCYIRSRKT